MASYGWGFRLDKCSQCKHLVPRGRKCPYCGNFDLLANVQESPLEVLTDKVEDFWRSRAAWIRIFVGLVAVLLIIAYAYTAYKAHS
jgi:ribosomal protein L32